MSSDVILEANTHSHSFGAQTFAYVMWRRQFFGITSRTKTRIHIHRWAAAAAVAVAVAFYLSPLLFATHTHTHKHIHECRWCSCGPDVMCTNPTLCTRTTKLTQFCVVSRGQRFAMSVWKIAFAAVCFFLFISVKTRVRTFFIASIIGGICAIIFAVLAFEFESHKHISRSCLLWPYVRSPRAVIMSAA